jgi:MFS family permease
MKKSFFTQLGLYNMIFGAGVFGIFAFVPLYATSVHKLSTLISGMILTPRSIGIIPASAITSFVLKRWGYRWPMVLGLIIIFLSTILLADQGLQLLRMLGINFGVAETLAILIMVTGIGMGIALPASNNACIELMPEKVATITGLRGMFRGLGGAIGISLITIILHLSSTPGNGFSITFISFGLGLLFTIPLVFLMPAGKEIEEQGSNL